MKNLKLLTVSAIVLLFACKGKDGEQGPSGILKGDAIGYLNVYDENGASLSNKAGVTVTVEGSSPVVSAVSDSTGKYTLKDLSQGTYDLSFSKSGYGTYKKFGYSFTGGSKPTYSTYGGIAAVSTVNPGTTLTLDTSLSSFITVSGKISGSFTGNKMIRGFLSTSSNVSGSNYIGSFYAQASISDGSFNFSFQNYSFATLGIAKGTKVYFVVYGDNNTSYASYKDPSTMKYVYPCLSANKSDVISFKAL